MCFLNKFAGSFDLLCEFCGEWIEPNQKGYVCQGCKTKYDLKGFPVKVNGELVRAGKDDKN
jgi:hypothetical protein